MTPDRCAACSRDLPSTRTRLLTCDERCHQAWIDRLVREQGETKRITDLSTGKTHLVPTRVILEQGVTGKDLAGYPEGRDVTSEGQTRLKTTTTRTKT